MERPRWTQKQIEIVDFVGSLFESGEVNLDEAIELRNRCFTSTKFYLALRSAYNALR